MQLMAVLKSLERPVTLTCVAMLVLLGCNLLPLAWGLPFLIQSVPDDGFYYLVLAKNFAESGRWTFDGQTPASGFHLVFAYLASAVYYLVPAITFETIYTLSTLFNTALIGAAVYILCTINTSIGFTRGNIAVVLVALSSVGLRLPGFPIESCLVVFFTAIAFYLVVPGLTHANRNACAAFFIGVLGVLSRTDWGAVPFALAGGVLVHALWVKTVPAKRLMVTLGLLCFGAIVGEALVVLHTYAFTGGLVQQSAMVKNHWAQVSGYSLLPGLARVAELLGPGFLPRPITLFVAGLLGVAILAYKRLAFVLDRPLALASVLIVVGYVIVYALNGAVQYWYAASFFVAVSILTAMAWSLLPARYDAAKPVMLALFLVGSAVQMRSPPWTWAPAMISAGEYLKTKKNIAPVGSWNAGIIRFFAERPVINLDGLVNDEVAEFVVTGRFADYVKQKKIKYIIDFAGMVSPESGTRGGYADGRFSRCLQAENVIQPHLQFLDHPMTVFTTDLACLARHDWP